MPLVREREALPHEAFPGVVGKVVHGDGMTFAFWDLPAGTVVPEHDHHHEQILHIVSGRVEVTLSGERFQAGPRDTVVIPSHAPHALTCLEDASLIDVFHPARPEYGRTD